MPSLASLPNDNIDLIVGFIVDYCVRSHTRIAHKVWSALRLTSVAFRDAVDKTTIQFMDTIYTGIRSVGCDSNIGLIAPLRESLVNSGLDIFHVLGSFRRKHIGPKSQPRDRLLAYMRARARRDWREFPPLCDSSFSRSDDSNTPTEKERRGKKRGKKGRWTPKRAGKRAGKRVGGYTSDPTLLFPSVSPATLTTSMTLRLHRLPLYFGEPLSHFYDFKSTTSEWTRFHYGMKVDQEEREGLQFENERGRKPRNLCLRLKVPQWAVHWMEDGSAIGSSGPSSLRSQSTQRYFVNGLKS